MKPSSLISKLGKENPTDSNKVLENIRKLGGNKSCFDCGEKGVTYVVPKFGTFVCSKCSGVHREIGNMVKGLGVSNFSDKEINFLQEMGNDNAKEIWMAKFNPEKHKLPKATDENSIKDHLKLKYVEKKWYKKTSNDKDEEEKDKKPSKKRKSDSSDDEQDIKPSTLKKSNKNLVMVNTDKKKTEELPQQPNQQQKLKKLNIGEKSNSVFTNQNNTQEWNPNFNQVNQKTNKQDPFETSGNKNNQQHHDDDFDFTDISTQPQNQGGSNPFNWGAPTETKITTSVPVTQPNQNRNNNLNEMFDFTSPSLPNNQVTNQSSINNINITNIHVIDPIKVEEKQTQQPKKNIDDLLSMLNKTSINENPPVNQNFQNPYNQYPNNMNGFYPQQNYPQNINPQMIMQNPQLMAMLHQMMQNQMGGQQSNFQQQGNNFDQGFPQEILQNNNQRKVSEVTPIPPQKVSIYII